jgi:hypothetical protein
MAIYSFALFFLNISSKEWPRRINVGKILLFFYKMSMPLTGLERKPNQCWLEKAVAAYRNNNTGRFAYL